MMHILAEQVRSLDETAQAVDLAQTPAEIVFLSFTDSDLSLAARVHAQISNAPSLRLASLAALQHPYSVDLYFEKVVSKARFVLVRCLGGQDYWRYGIDELNVAAKTHGFDLAIVPGDGMEDPRLDAASTLEVADLKRIRAWFQAGGPDNMSSLFGWLSRRLGQPALWKEPIDVPSFGFWPERQAARDGASRALVIFYRAFRLSGDTAPIAALNDALRQRGFDVASVFVTSLKDPETTASLTHLLRTFQPDVILNTTGFSSRMNERSVLDRADAPVIQAIIATSFREAWQQSCRGLGAADLAMNVVLPEVDGRIIGPAISFKADGIRADALEFTPVFHRPERRGIEVAADLATSWARLRHVPRIEKKIALVLSEYPAKGGRTGYAIGLDGPASLAAIADDLRDAGFDIAALPAPAALILQLERQNTRITLPLATYQTLFQSLSLAFRTTVLSAWGEPEADPAFHDGSFHFKAFKSGKLILAVQPDRGQRTSRSGDYHDPNLPPRHAYIAFYLWLRAETIDALIHLGTHGTLEWLPGKAVALSENCVPAALIGAVPVIYPFIVNNPGEATQAKRRLSAVMIGHMTPPLRIAGAHGVTEEIERLLDEFSSAQMLDRRRADRLADLILARAKASDLFAECGLTSDLDRAAALARLDAWICDVKDMRINDGLHVFGRLPEKANITETARAIGVSAGQLTMLLERSVTAEREALIAALDGHFVAPGPAGAPAKGRLDVLPTGRNLYAVDPRAVPTRTAWEIGSKIAEEIIARYVQDRGEWPKRIVIDLWGSASMRTGGDDLAQAFALMGVRPKWDNASTRISGFKILSPARLGRPRVDVTLRISGLFRDVFPVQVALFDQAVNAVAALDEDDESNPLAAASRLGVTPRIFGAAPGAYGTGLSSMIVSGAWQERSELGKVYLDASRYAYSLNVDGVSSPDDFHSRVREADVFVHVQDMAGQDILDSDAFSEHEGGFAAAANLLGSSPALYHIDATHESAKVRTTREEIARVLRARAINPQWIEGQMRHGYRGASEIAETISNLFAFAALTDAVDSYQFDLMFEATLGDECVRDFMLRANPTATVASARLFESAIARGFWITRRNSVAAQIAEIVERAT
ncbi:MAG TPA: cobaltochelatase subunit CobN [Methylocella sp.]|nr:cobaltochelatase subunit CobN [Methylocella sp.]